MRTLSDVLFSAGPVAEFDGRFYITAGHPGFNSRENNARGYDSPAAAERAIAHHAGEARRANIAAWLAGDETTTLVRHRMGLVTFEA